QAELFVPIEREPGPAERVVAVARTRPLAGEVGRVGRDLVGDYTLLDILLLRQAQVLLGRDITKHGRAAPAGQRRADGAGDVVVARSYVGHKRAQDIEGGFFANIHLTLDVHVDLVHGNVPRTLDHDLRVLLPAALGQFTQHVELGELCGVAGIGDRTRPETVAQAPGDVVLVH